MPTLSLTEHRMRMNVTQVEMARLLKIDQPALCRIERGRRKPAVRRLKWFARAYKLSTDDFLEAWEESARRSEERDA